MSDETATARGAYRGRALLDNPHRAAIVDQLGRTPGLNKNQLRKRLDVYGNLLEFHLGRLEEAGLVVTRPGAQGREVLCFRARDEHLWGDERVRILYGRRPIRRVALTVDRQPGASADRLAEVLDLSSTTVCHHLRNLREADLARRSRVAQRVEYYPTARLEAWVDRHGDGYRPDGTPRASPLAVRPFSAGDRLPAVERAGEARGSA